MEIKQEDIRTVKAAIGANGRGGSGRRRFSARSPSFQRHSRGENRPGGLTTEVPEELSGEQHGTRVQPTFRRVCQGVEPSAGSSDDPESQAYFTGGYAAMRAGLRDGARRPDDQDIDGISAEILYPGWFPMF